MASSQIVANMLAQGEQKGVALHTHRRQSDDSHIIPRSNQLMMIPLDEAPAGSEWSTYYLAASSHPYYHNSKTQVVSEWEAPPDMPHPVGEPHAALDWATEYLVVGRHYCDELPTTSTPWGEQFILTSTQQAATASYPNVKYLLKSSPRYLASTEKPQVHTYTAVWRLPERPLRVTDGYRFQMCDKLDYCMAVRNKHTLA